MDKLDLYSKLIKVDGFCGKALKSWMTLGILDKKMVNISSLSRHNNFLVPNFF